MGDNTNKWTEAQLEWLSILVESYEKLGKNVKWNDVAAEIHHTAESCRVMALKIRAQRRNEQLRAEMREIKAREKLKPKEVVRAKPWIEPKRPFDTRDYMRSTSTAKFTIDADLRARISIQGPNGLFGDPLPGRSMLDKRVIEDTRRAHASRLNQTCSESEHAS